MEANQIVFDFITKKDSITEKPTPESKPVPVFVIDYENIENNDFLIVNQMKYNGIHKNSIPDIVVYINGLASGVGFSVIESFFVIKSNTIWFASIRVEA
jgi:type I restriction enzyme R subunit